MQTARCRTGRRDDNLMPRTMRRHNREFEPSWKSTCRRTGSRSPSGDYDPELRPGGDARDSLTVTGVPEGHRTAARPRLACRSLPSDKRPSRRDCTSAPHEATLIRRTPEIGKQTVKTERRIIWTWLCPDASGHAVSGLQSSDFTVLDDNLAADPVLPCAGWAYGRTAGGDCAGPGHDEHLVPADGHGAPGRGEVSAAERRASGAAGLGDFSHRHRGEGEPGDARRQRLWPPISRSCRRRCM